MATANVEKNLSALEFLGMLSDITVEAKVIQEDWALLTYDLPNTAEGTAVRHQFLKKARWLGAVQHTQSCYLLPWTKATNSIILQLAEAGDIFVFYSNGVADMNIIELSNSYDTKVMDAVADLEERMDRIENHLSEEKYKTARKMFRVSWERIQSITVAICARGNEVVAKRLQEVIMRLKAAEQNADYQEDINNVISR